jgi:hypothetical protein
MGFLLEQQERRGREFQMWWCKSGFSESRAFDNARMPSCILLQRVLGYRIKYILVFYWKTQVTCLQFSFLAAFPTVIPHDHCITQPTAMFLVTLLPLFLFFKIFLKPHLSIMAFLTPASHLTFLLPYYPQCHPANSVLVSFFVSVPNTWYKQLKRIKGLFWLVVSEVSGHTLIVSVAFRSVAKQKHHWGKAWREKPVYLLAARKQREEESRTRDIFPGNDPSDSLPTRPHVLLFTTCTTQLVN